MDFPIGTISLQFQWSSICAKPVTPSTHHCSCVDVFLSSPIPLFQRQSSLILQMTFWLFFLMV